MKKFLLSVFFATLLFCKGNLILAQESIPDQEEAPRGWHHYDREKDHYNGVSTEQAYALLQGKESRPVVVAVIDSGVDTDHEDLKDVMWVNDKEIAGNGIGDHGRCV